MSAYYNEFDSYAAQWLRNLIKAGHLPDGEVDERSIRDVQPDDLRGFVQCHFFAGIGVWSLAARNSGWRDDEPLWTGSCPCQPFSAAGKRGGFDDERHLWPTFFGLIRERRPPIVLGEQVASKDGLGWFDAVHADLEGADYAVGAVDLCAAGVGAPHIRQRLWWVGLADAERFGRERWRAGKTGVAGREETLAAALGSRDARGLADDHGEGRGVEPERDGGPLAGREACEPRPHADGRGGLRGLADAALCGQREERADGVRSGARDRPQGLAAGPFDGGRNSRPRPAHVDWRDADWLLCRDGKWRPVEPRSFPLAHGAPARVGRLRAFGNAIVEPAARAFILSVKDVIEEHRP